MVGCLQKKLRCLGTWRKNWPHIWFLLKTVHIKKSEIRTNSMWKFTCFIVPWSSLPLKSNIKTLSKGVYLSSTVLFLISNAPWTKKNITTWNKWKGIKCMIMMSRLCDSGYNWKQSIGGSVKDRVVSWHEFIWGRGSGGMLKKFLIVRVATPSTLSLNLPHWGLA